MTTLSIVSVIYLTIGFVFGLAHARALPRSITASRAVAKFTFWTLLGPLVIFGAGLVYITCCLICAYLEWRYDIQTRIRAGETDF